MIFFDENKFFSDDFVMFLPDKLSTKFTTEQIFL